MATDDRPMLLSDLSDDPKIDVWTHGAPVRVPPNFGWLKLTVIDCALPVYVWATDVNMVKTLSGGGSLVYLRHGSETRVGEATEWILEQVDRIADRVRIFDEGHEHDGNGH